MNVYITHIKNTLNPLSDREQFLQEESLSISEWVSRYDYLDPKKQPVICLINGDPILQKFWDTVFFMDQDIVTFIRLPEGGGSVSFLGSLMSSMASAASAVFTGEAFAFMGLSSGMTAAMGKVAGSIVIMGGGMLLNALLPPPSLPSTLQGQDASPTYNLQAQGNNARIGESIPSLYGRHMIFPDYAAMPYHEYSNNDQYLYQLFCIGQGFYDFESIRIADTPVENFNEIEYEIVEPGEKVTLFPTVVYTSDEVGGQEMEYNIYVGPYVLNPSTTTVTKIAIDVEFPRGIYDIDGDGDIDDNAIAWQVEAQTVDDDGNPLGNWQIIGSHSLNEETTTPQRRTYFYNVAEGRYQIRLIRTNNYDDDHNIVGDVIHWSTARGYSSYDEDYGDVTLVAMRMKATDNLANQTNQQVNFIVTRKLPAWDPVNGWSSPVATRSIAWALADIVRAPYGAGLDDDHLPLDKLYQYDQLWAQRGDYFDGIFDNQLAVIEALRSVARTGRSLVYTLMGIIEFVRDEYQPIAVTSFGPGQIQQGTFQIEYVIPDENTVDAVEIEYFDSQYWQWKTVLCQLPDSTAEKPAKQKFFGVTSREHAWREGMFMAACNKYRRILPSFNSELQGYIPVPLDLVGVNHDLASWGQSGRVLAYDDVNLIMTLSNEPFWTSGMSHQIAFLDADGSMTDPILVSEVLNEPYQVQLAEAPTIPIYTGQEKDKTAYFFGTSNAYIRECKIAAIRPLSEKEIEMTLVNEDIRVHQADETGYVPPDEGWPYPPPVNVKPGPVEDLRVIQTGTAVAPQLQMSWRPADGAESYVIEWALAVQNLITWSEKLENSPWVHQGNIQVTDQSAIGPDGQYSLAKLVSPNGVEGDYLYQHVTIPAFNEYFTFSFYIDCRFTPGFELRFSETGGSYSVVVEFEVFEGEPRIKNGNGTVQHISRFLYRVSGLWYNERAVDAVNVNIIPATAPLPPVTELSSVIGKQDIGGSTHKTKFQYENIILDQEVIPEDYIIPYGTIMGLPDETFVYAGCCSFHRGMDQLPYVETQDTPILDYSGWTMAGTTHVTTYTLNVTQGHVWLRVCGVALLRGDYAYWNGFVYEIIPPRDVQNLQFQTDNNGTYFGIMWDQVQRASHYRIQVSDLDTGVLLREVSTTDTSYIYTAENSVEDGGPYREVIFDVKAVGPGGESPNWATVSGGNPAPAPPSDVSVFGLAGQCVVTFTRPADRDFAGVLIAISDQQGFTPDLSTVVWDGSDTMAAIASLADGTPLEAATDYFLRLTSYDTFGKTDLDWSDQEYVFNTIESELTSKEILEMIRDSLTDPGMQPIDGDFIFNSNRFAVKIPDTDEDIYPFIISYIDDVAYVAIQGEILLLGNVSIDNLTEGELPTDVWMKLGGGSIVLHGEGYIAIYSDMETVENRDFLLQTHAALGTFVYRDGAYHLYKQLNRTESGQAQSGETVQLPGYWNSAPVITLSPLSLMIYDATYSSQSQQMNLDARNLTEYAPNKYQFDAIAELQIFGNQGNTGVNLGTDTSNNTWTTGAVNLNPNTVSITFNFSSLSIRGTGQTTHDYYYRQVVVDCQVTVNGTDWTSVGSTTLTMGGQITNPIHGSVSASLIGNETQVRLVFTASDAGGTFNLGPPEYNTGRFTTAPSSDAIYIWHNQEDSGNCIPATQTVTLDAFTPPPDGEITQIEYHYTAGNTWMICAGFSPYVAMTFDIDSCGSWVQGAGRRYDYAEAIYCTDGSRYMFTSGTDIVETVSTNTYNPQITFKVVNSSLKASDLYAHIDYRVLIKNSSTPANRFDFISFDWELGDTTVLAEGTLNWVAVGES